MKYFAHGSNINLYRMQQRCEDNFRIISSAQLLGYEFGFDKRGYANIRFKKNSEV